MSKKYQVTYIYDEEIEGQEVYYELEHYEYDEELEEYVDIKGRYEARAAWEAQEILDTDIEYFEFDHYPSIKEVEGVLLERLKMKAYDFEDYALKYGTIYDTDTCEVVSESDEEIFETLSYTGKFEVYSGAVSSIEVEEIEE